MNKSEIRVNDSKIVTVINVAKIVKSEEQDGTLVETTYYDVNEPKVSAWFTLDLETGKRGWFPGKEEIDNNKQGE